MMTISEQTRMTAPQPILARQYLLPRDTSVDSATRVAERVIQSINATGGAVVDFAGVGGVSSTYFNTLFRIVGEAVGVDRMATGLTRRCESAAQRHIADRSWEAVLELLRGKDRDNEVA